MWVWPRAGALLLAVRATWAGPSEIAVRLTCPVLSDVSAAEFEARAKVDVSVRATRGGELEVVCDQLAARLRWRERGGEWVARSMPPSASPATLIDALLVASKDLVEEAVRNHASRPGAALDQESAGADAAEQGEPAGQEGAGDVAGGRDRASKDGGRDRPARRKEADGPSDRAVALPRDDRTWAWSACAGGGAALFSSSGTGVVGPSVGVSAQLPLGFVTSVTGEYDLGFGTGDVVSVRVASAAVVISALFGPSRAFEVGVGGFAGNVWVSSAAPYQPTSRAQALWGAILHGRYAIRADAWRFALGPDIRFYGFRPEVAVDNTVVWSVPAVSGGLSLEVSRTLYGAM